MRNLEEYPVTEAEILAALDSAIELMLADSAFGDIRPAALQEAKRRVLRRENPCAGIFNFKWLDPECVHRGCQSLVLKSRMDEMAALLIVAAETLERVPIGEWPGKATRDQKLHGAHQLLDRMRVAAGVKEEDDG